MDLLYAVQSSNKAYVFVSKLHRLQLEIHRNYDFAVSLSHKGGKINEFTVGGSRTIEFPHVLSCP